MTFGRLTSKFRIFRSPMEMDLHKVGKVVVAATKLHYFIINKQLVAADGDEDDDSEDNDCSSSDDIVDNGVRYFESGYPDEEEAMVGTYVSGSVTKDNEIAIVPSQVRRIFFVNFISEEGLQRPTHNVARNKK